MSIKYDYIIAGSGCAGLSLLFSLLQDPILNQKNILVLDNTLKNKNDRTWCFWEKGQGRFESIVCHQWQTLEFITDDFQSKFDLDKYRYKMIKGDDFYHYVLNCAKEFDNVVFKTANILDIKSNNLTSTVMTEDSTYSSTFVFNSTKLFYPEMDTTNSLLQHFEGWVIKTKEDRFDPSIGTLMDFRLDQSNGDTFMYVLPTSPTEALVEYTLFSEKILEKNKYKEALEEYIKQYLSINDYEVLHKEFGVIPMSLASFNRTFHPESNIINIGTAGGFTKASSGYTFQFIQKNVAFITRALQQGLHPGLPISKRDKMFQWYDRTLLEVILSNKMTGKEIFGIMFKKLSPEKILAFLGNESTLLDEIVIMNSVPKATFIKAGIKQMI